MKHHFFKHINACLFAFSAVAMPALQAHSDGFPFVSEEEVFSTPSLEAIEARFFATYGIYLHEAIQVILSTGTLTDPELVAINNRITQDTLEIGNFLAQFYGPEVANNIAVALAQFAVTEEEYTLAIATGNAVLAANLLAEWRAEGAAIANYFALLDPSDISAQVLNNLIQNFITTETLQIAFYATANYPAAIQAYDQSRAQLIAIGDYILEAGIDNHRHHSHSHSHN